MRFAAKSDIGRLRDINEDSFLAEDALFVVADGMGGHKAGEIASALGISTFRENFGPPVAGTSVDRIMAAMRNAVAAANDAVHKTAAGRRDYTGMGTTLTAAFFAGMSLYLAQVGDSRAYLTRDGVVTQLTEDHTLVNEMVQRGEIDDELARIHPLRHVITRALGTFETVEPDLSTMAVQPGDMLLLCSDGLSSKLNKAAIAAVISTAKGPKNIVNKLIKAALEAGGEDNITVVFIEFTEADFV